jgi:hypothetical protein
MAITYTVPTPFGTATRKSAAHTMAGQRYRFVTAHIWAETGKLFGYTWHSRRDLAAAASTGYRASRPLHVVEILDEHCHEHAKRKAA